MTPEGREREDLMAQNLLHEMRGVLIACVARKYDGFKDREGNEQAGGTTRSLWVSGAFDQAPTEVKIPLAHVTTYDRAVALGLGAHVEVVAEIRARGGELGLRLVSLEPVQPKNPPAAN